MVSTAEVVLQTVRLECGHALRYRIGRGCAESGFARNGVAWFCDPCDPTHHTQRLIVAVHNAPVDTDETADGNTRPAAR
jgi:hypothetical protein